MYLVWSERFKNSLESPYRLARSRTLDFHSKNRGSNPRGDARGWWEKAARKRGFFVPVEGGQKNEPNGGERGKNFCEAKTRRASEAQFNSPPRICFFVCRSLKLEKRRFVFVSLYQIKSLWKILTRKVWRTPKGYSSRAKLISAKSALQRACNKFTSSFSAGFTTLRGKSEPKIFQRERSGSSTRYI